MKKSNHSIVGSALRIAIAVASLFLSLSVPNGGAGPADKTAVKGSAISLPSGAGSIEGLGESFEPQLNTGGSSYGVKIAVPPGRAGLTPSVSLDYNSYSGNGVSGIGWSLGFLSIKRQADKGFPEYNDGDTFVFQGEELVPLANAGQDWRCENERDFQRFRRIDSDSDGIPDAWEVTERNGNKHTLGKHRGLNNRWSVVEHPEKASLSSFDRTYCWMLDSTTDLHGNHIDYEYNQGIGVLYPSRISYSHLEGAVHEVLFQYEPRPDAFDDYRPTFSSRLDQRLKRIEVRSQGQLVRAYNFAYAYEPGDLTPDVATLQATYLDLGVTLLKRVIQVDRSGNDSNFLPPLLFTYSGLDLTKAELRTIASPPQLDLAEPNGRVQLADLDGDALPDLFSTQLEGAGLVQRVCLNRGETNIAGEAKLLFAPSRLVLGTSPVDIGQSNAVVHDPKGKGLVDLSCLTDVGGNKRLETFGNRARLDVANEERLGFSQENLETTELQNPPQFVSYSDARTRQMDVNFDKRSDFVNLEPGFGGMKVNTFYISRGGTWVPTESTLPPSYPLANTFADQNGQPNPCVHLADMNGDRMLDLVCLAPRPTGAGQRIVVSYWPLCGLGRYAEERQISSVPPDDFDIGGADLRDVLIDDFTGDGLADVIVMDGTGPETVLSLRVNIAGQRWSPPYVRKGLPRYAPRDPANPTVLRLADLNANGSVELLFRNTAPEDSWVYVELLPTGAPSILTGIDNSIGKRTTIVYGSAAQDEQRARDGGHPWRTFAPISLQVVRQIRITSGQDMNGDGREDTAVSEFRYRDPYYDGFEREFRGFAFAERIDYGDDFLFDSVTGLMQVSSGWDRASTPTAQVSGPSLVTRYRFHTGAADQRDNDDYDGNQPPFRLIDEFTPVAGREEEVLKGLPRVEEKIDPVVLHSAPDAGFDAGCEAAAAATTPEAEASITPDAYVYSRSLQDWKVRRLYRPAHELPFTADQDANGVLDTGTYSVAPVPAGRFNAAGTTVVAGNGHSVSYAFAARTVTEIRDANGLLSASRGYPARPPVTTLVLHDQDDYGNPILQQDFGVDGAGYDDERFTTTTYAHGGNALALWVIDKPDTVTVTDENGSLVSKRVHFYDGAAFVGVQGQIQDRALLSRTLEHLDATHTVQATRARFDDYGNSIETRDPVGNTRQVAWDSVFKTYPVSETIVVGNGSADLVLSADYDLGFGVVTNSTDFNGNPTSYRYDSFARLVKIVRPGDTAALPTLSFDYQPVDAVRGRAFAYDFAGNLTRIDVPLGSANRVTTRQRRLSGQADEFVTVVYSDGSGKVLAHVEEGETSGTWIVKKATSYNLRLKTQSQWLPFQVASLDVPQFAAFWASGRPPATDGVNPAIVSKDIYFDPLGREIRTVEPPETWGGPRRSTATQYLPLEKRLFDEEDLRSGSSHFDTPHVELSDGLDRLIAVEEVVKLTDAGLPGPVTTWRTEYTYNLNDQVTRTRDSQNNIRTMAFDARRRMIELVDPDRGKTTFVYDDASNVRETVDAKGQKIVYTYDGANRLKTEDYQDGGPRVFDVEYFYDVPEANLDLGNGARGVAANTKGQIAHVRDLSGETHFSFDARGRIAWEVKRVPDRLHHELVSYRTQFLHDSADRLETLTYPDGDQLKHTYNSRNLLGRIYGDSLGDVVSSITYRPSGQLERIRFGNRVGTAHAYDPRLRLTRLETTNSQNARLIDFAYEFDGVSNLERIQDLRVLAGLPDAAQRFNTQVFSYDDLYRLTRAEYPALGAPTTNRVTYRFDRIGNMLAQTSDIIQLEHGLPVANLGEMDSGGAAGRSGRTGRKPNDPPGPHALTAIRNSSFPARNYGYDDNGNLISLDGLVCEWDFKDRLAAVENQDMRAVYTYDYTDHRVTKSIHWKNPGPDTGSQVSSLNPAWRSTTTHYINQYFEVRDHDAEVKYVWHEHTRVARISTTLGTPNRIQHLRLQRGWNNVCLSVGGRFAALDPANNSDVDSCAYWSATAAGNGFIQVTAGTSIPAGATAWVHAKRDHTIMLVGTPASRSPVLLTGNSQFVGNAFSEPLNLTSTLPSQSWFSHFDETSAQWQNRFSSDPAIAFLNDAPTLLLPGDALWLTGAPPGLIGTNLTALQVRYYHQDHLGSSSCITDELGQLDEQTSYFAFGGERYRWSNRSSAESYQFTQKEKDKESGLNYFEARFQSGSLSRFLSVDPLAMAMPADWRTAPQKQNPYAYANNNPLKFIDPNGLEITVAGDKDYRKQVQTALKRIDPSARVDMKTGKVSHDPKTSVKGHEKGHELIDRMVASKHNVTIEHTTGSNEAGATDRDAAADKSKGSGGTVSWNPKGQTQINTLVGANKAELKGRPTFIGLGHELIHGDHYQRGVYVKSRDDVEYTTLTGTKATGRSEELRTVGLGSDVKKEDITENQLRKEGGQKSRASY